MNYENCTNEEYNYECLYCYTIEHKHELYRIHFIVCNRVKIDEFMNHLE